MKNFHLEGRTSEGEIIKTSSEGPISLDIYQLQGMGTVRTVRIRGKEKETGILSLVVEVEDLNGEIAFSHIVTIREKRHDPEKE